MGNNKALSSGAGTRFAGLEVVEKWRAAGGFCTWEMARTKKLKQEGKQFLKMGFAKLRNWLVNYNYATDFRNPAKIRKVAKIREVVKFRKVAKISASETRLLDQPASKFFRFLQ